MGTYLNPSAGGGSILLVSRIVVALWALVMAVASIVLWKFDIGLGWVYCFMGIWIGSAVCPVACCIWTDKLNACFAILAAWLGWVAALITWVVVGASIEGEHQGTVSKDSLGQLDAQLWGGLMALLVSLLICMIGCCVAPQKFDWNIMIEGIKLVGGDGGENSKVLGDEWESKPEFLNQSKKWIRDWAWGLSIFLCVIWPGAAVPFGVMGKSTFQLWAMIALVWGWTMGLTIVTLPVLESTPWFFEKCCGGGSKEVPKTTATEVTVKEGEGAPAAETATA